MGSVYVAGRTSDLERVRKVQKMFTDRGWDVTFDWTGADGEIRNAWRGTDAEQRGRALANTERGAVWDADLVVLCWKDSDGTRPGMVGALIEVGIALGHGQDVWIVGPSRDSVFFCLSEVTVLEHEDDIPAEIDREYEGRRAA